MSQGNTTVFSQKVCSLRASSSSCLPPTTPILPLSSPPDPEEEDRKNKVRRWMVATKFAVYNVAQLYLKGSQYDLDVAIEGFEADEQWEKEHPINGKRKQKDRPQRRVGAGHLSQFYPNGLMSQMRTVKTADAPLC